MTSIGLIAEMVAAEDELPVGASKLGGRPDLPDGVDWPETDDAWPHSLVAQIDLATVRSPELPPDGLLSFFRDPDQQAMEGRGPHDRPAWQVFYTPAGTPLTRRDWHPDVTEQNRFPAMRLVPAQAGPHWLLGDPADDAAGEKEYAQLAANGIDCYDGAMRWNPEEENWFEVDDSEIDDLLGDAHGWRVLLRVQGQPEIQMGWARSPVGFLYYLIRVDDLAARRFAAAWSLLVEP